ncbi:hypothetical protein chiPu_0012258 [Chiloscyllium punctatum]|uniref:SPIN-DOC-like zinc-finger domain-containing protein n=1 Tax=Chiloscyllium punctatum TaxID=137246 RepID=A0A401STP9_CHIPU|nr:hypothetical protein [Chiloscyllium punctatum]
MSEAKKRTLKGESRVFKEEWNLKYYVVAMKDKMMCLHCDAIILIVKKCNEYQHHATYKDHKYAKLEVLAQTFLDPTLD